jgi:maltose alpha-D-glucosyltransferase/alpha-amylase
VRFLDDQNKKVLSYLCIYKDDIALVINNLSRYSQFIQIDVQEYAGYTPVDLFGGTVFPKLQKDRYFITIGPHQFYWFRLQK